MSWLGGCKHIKFTEVKPDGFQYCLECKKAFQPVRTPQSHVLKDIDTSSVIKKSFFQGVPVPGSDREQSVITQQCTRCGKLFSYNATSGWYANENPSGSQCTV